MARSQKVQTRVSHAVMRKRATTHATARSRRATPAAGTPPGHEGRAARPRPYSDVRYQTAIRNFEIAVRAFQKQNYGKAAEIFEKLAHSDTREVAERAQLHLRLIRQRTGRPVPPKSAEDLYAMGIACLNVRQLGEAVEHLSKANRLKPNQDHVHYALAVSHALGGNADAAFAHLETAFSLRPENRIHARRDEDFQGLLADPRFRRLVSPPGTP
jgi:tetratricopeptide (TPR) repeat protein